MDQLKVVRMGLPIDLISEQDSTAYPEPTNAEWLNLASSAFEFWDNPVDAIYDDL